MGILLFIPVDCKLHDRRIWIHNGQPHMFLCACDWDWEWLPVKSVDLLLWQFCMVQIPEQHTIAQLHNRAKTLFNRLLQLNGAHKHRWTYTFSSGLWISISNISMAGFMAGLRMLKFYRGKIEFVYEDHGKCGQYSNVLNWHLWCLASLSPSLSFAHYLSLCSASPSQSHYKWHYMYLNAIYVNVRGIVKDRENSGMQLKPKHTVTASDEKITSNIVFFFRCLFSSWTLFHSLPFSSPSALSLWP